MSVSRRRQASSARSRQAVPLSRERVVAAAVALADHAGLAAVTMRAVGEALGVEAMSLYNHVASKDELLDGMVDVVFAQIELPRGPDWQAAVRRRCHSARRALLEHGWAVGLLESRRTPGPATLSHHDAMIGCLSAAGFCVALVAHTLAAVDAYVYGFALQELNLPFTGAQDVPEVASEVLAAAGGRYPHLARFAAEHVLKEGYAFGDEFGWGLELLLEAIEARRRSPQLEV